MDVILLARHIGLRPPSRAGTLALAAVVAGRLAMPSPALAGVDPVPRLLLDPGPRASAARAAATCKTPGRECLPDGKLEIGYYDPSGVCTWTMRVTWGDGSAATTKKLTAGGSVTASHTYTAPGLYAAVINFPAGTSSDPDRSCAPLRATRNVEVPDPTADDRDGDGIGDVADNCRFAPNRDQSDGDGDGAGDVCDSDNDNDGIADARDNCPSTRNSSQSDADKDKVGDACDPYTSRDTDKDRVPDQVDNCLAAANSSQADRDRDRIGNACDSKVGKGGDTTFSNPRNVRLLRRSLPGRPFIQQVRVQDSFGDGLASRGDLIGVDFSESMAASVVENGASLRLKDADGTVAYVTCGSSAICTQNRGNQRGLNNRAVSDRQGLGIILSGRPFETSPGGTAGLQFPAMIDDANDQIKDAGDQPLDLAKGDVTAEIASIVP